MKVRHKISLVAIMGLFLGALFSGIVLRSLFMNYADKVENTIVSQNFNRAMSVIQKEESSLASTIMDWAYWDDTFNYLNGTNSQYVDINLQDNTLTALSLNFMGFYNSTGDTVFAKAIEMDETIESSFMQELQQGFKKQDYYSNLILSTKPISGLLIVSGQPLLISISPVTTSNLEAPHNGVIVFAKLIDQQFLDYLNDVLKVGINFHTTDDPKILEALKENRLRLSSDETTLYINKTSDSVTSYALVNDINNETQIFLELDSARFMYRDGFKIIQYSGLTFIVIFLIISGICLLILEFSVFRRIEKLNQFMNSIKDKKQTSEMILLPGKDEISNLATSANNMLQELDSYYKEIKVNEERFKLIMEATNDGYFDTDPLMNKFYISPDLVNYLGYVTSKEFLDYDQVIEIIHPEDKTPFKDALGDCFKGNVEKLVVEFRAKKNSGEWLWLQCRGKIVRYDDFKNPKRLIGNISDITQRKNYEAENLYLSQTDMLTTLKNRTFVEVLLEKADKCSSCNTGIIMGDINGLRLINDTLGHHEGDRLLRGIGEILKKCCSCDDVPARWGGDEFIILIKDSPDDYLDILIEKIKKECVNITGYQTPISLSWGRAKKDTLHTNMKAVIKLAEERMYRNKLLESRSAKNSILSSLEQSLHEKHIETEEHTKRIAQMCGLIGKKMGLSQEELDEAALLSLLHDIGKIGIPEAILLKPDKLTTDEWEVMKTHSEIGYRIAISTPDLAHVANEILCHHERYDGTGYPQGLKGKEIPKLSRLLTIVDSFDVMTHTRHYKEAMTIQDAVSEIKNCSGKQFDPEMVEQFLTILQEDEDTQKLVDNTP